MMVSPCTMYEEYITMDEDSLKMEITCLRQKIARLERRVKSDSRDEVIICPSLDVELYTTRDYLDKAILACSKLGYEFSYTKKEQRRNDFLEGLSRLKEIKLEIETFAKWRETHVLTFLSEQVQYDYEYSLLGGKDEKSRTILDETDVLTILEETYIEEWKRRYFKPVLDGESWSLSIRFADKRAKKYYGCNDYPKTFKKLLYNLKKWREKEKS